MNTNKELKEKTNTTNQNTNDNTEERLKNIDTEKNQIKKEKHLTSHVHIRFRGHPSEMIPHHGTLESNMPSDDIHDNPK